jgi:hypothetical protein
MSADRTSTAGEPPDPVPQDQPEMGSVEDLSPAPDGAVAGHPTSSSTRDDGTLLARNVERGQTGFEADVIRRWMMRGRH